MKVEAAEDVGAGAPGETAGDLVAVGVVAGPGSEGPVLRGELPPGLPAPFGALVLDRAQAERHDFTGAVGQILVAGRPDPAGPEIVAVGVGELDAPADRVREALRRAAAAFVRGTGSGSRAALVVPATGALSTGDAAAALAEGAMLAAYRFDRFRTGDRPAGLGTLQVVGPPTGGGRTGRSADEVTAGVARGVRLADSVLFARDLVNTPAGSLTPTDLADAFVDRFAEVDSVEVEVWDEERIVAERLGGLLGVASGSDQPPRFVRASYRPPEPELVGDRVPHLVLVGKGITFDSGGLSLKTPGGMETMKTDMGGAAAVMGALDAAAALGARIRITALTPLTENLPGGSAIKPGDVLTARNGRTIEVLNTDAEGRLVLADALSLAVELEPDAIVDLATLTGAVVAALGREIAGLLGTDDTLMEAVRTAGEESGEPSWPLPLPDEYRAHIDSEVADMRNVGRPGQAGSIAAALLLREFVGEVPWAHLDIAGTARTDERARYHAKGGTGFGVRTLAALATSEAAPGMLVGLGG